MKWRKNTWVRVFNPPVEGEVLRGSEGLDIGILKPVKNTLPPSS